MEKLQTRWCKQAGTWSVGGIVSFNFDIDVEAETKEEAIDKACEIAVDAPWEDQNVLDNTDAVNFIKLGEVECLEEPVWEEEGLTPGEMIVAISKRLADDSDYDEYWSPLLSQLLDQVKVREEE
jgi:hypothetical protein